MKKPDAKLLFGEKCMIFNAFSKRKTPINGPYRRRKKSPVKIIFQFWEILNFRVCIH
jgi:hypothetical protein